MFNLSWWSCENGVMKCCSDGSPWPGAEGHGPGLSPRAMAQGQIKLLYFVYAQSFRMKVAAPAQRLITCNHVTPPCLHLGML